MSLELPVLRLGLVGFSAEQQEYLSNLLKTRVVIRWQTWPFADADAWWVNGAHAQRLPNGIVRIPPADAQHRATMLNLAEVDRPMAFALPVHCGDIAPAFSFEATAPDSIVAVLRKFEAALRPLAAQFTLGSAIESRRRNLTSAIQHLSFHGRLLAVIDLGGHAGHSPSALPSDLEQADWSGRPLSAAAVPPQFVRISISELMWKFAVRTVRDVLPPRYRHSRLYFRRSPRVPGGMLKDTHLALIRELATSPATFAELQQRTGIGKANMAQALAALYFVGSVTSDPRRAGLPLMGQAFPAGTDSRNSRHSIAPSLLHSDLRSTPPTQDERHPDLTAPAPLRRTG